MICFTDHASRLDFVQVIAAEGEMNAARWLTEAAGVISESRQEAIQL